MPLYSRKNINVDIERLTPEMQTALIRLAHLWIALFPDDPDGMTVTSAAEGFSGDGVHGKDSLHYTGNAIDIRVYDVSCTLVKKDFVFLAKYILGKDYDVVYEGSHVHIEFDKKVT